jgi:hypothetical protein
LPAASTPSAWSLMFSMVSGMTSLKSGHQAHGVR